MDGELSFDGNAVKLQVDRIDLPANHALRVDVLGANGGAADVGELVVLRNFAPTVGFTTPATGPRWPSVTRSW